MAKRRVKPPGMEKWTWDEINARRKMSKSEKRTRRMAVAFGATKRTDGSIQPPTFEASPMYYVAFGFLFLFAILMMLLEFVGSKK